MKKKEISIPVIGLVGFVAGFVCLSLAGHSFIRYQRRCFKRTIDAIAEDLQKGFSIYDDEEIEAEAEENTPNPAPAAPADANQSVS